MLRVVPSPQQVYFRKELGRQVVAAISELPARQRLVVMGKMEGLEIDEIASWLGISKSSVSRAWSTAVKTLRERLADSGYR